MDCNIVDMMEALERPEIPTTAPTPSPVSSSHASNNKFVSVAVKKRPLDENVLSTSSFARCVPRPSRRPSRFSRAKKCGKSWQLANDNCSLATHCPE